MADSTETALQEVASAAVEVDNAIGPALETGVIPTIDAAAETAVASTAVRRIRIGVSLYFRK